MKKWLYDILENDQLNDGKKFLFDIFLAVIIILSIVPIFIENSEGELPFIFEKIELLENTAIELLKYSVPLLKQFYFNTENELLDVEIEKITKKQKLKF